MKHRSKRDPKLSRARDGGSAQGGAGDAAVCPITPELFAFGMLVFQAVAAGEMPPATTSASDIDLAAAQSVIHEVRGHGLSKEQEFSLAVRLLAFSDLVSRAEQDPRLADHLVQRKEGVEVTQPFIAAAAQAQMTLTEDGCYLYVIDSVARLLAH